MKLYLHKQTRNRDLDEYIQKLHINPSEFDKLNTSNSRILLVGGGLSPVQPEFSKTLFHITNIDFAPLECQTDKLHQITGNFLDQNLEADSFDEVWALYSLPLYAQQISSINIFMAKSILSLVPNGKLRMFPLEFSDNNKLVTRDAEWEISTMAVTDATLHFLSLWQPWGISFETISAGKDNEKNIIVKITADLSEKSVLNDKMMEVIQNQTEKLHKLSKIQIERED